MDHPGAAPVYASFIVTDATVAMCDPSGDHQGFANMRTTQGFAATYGWQPDLTHQPIEWGSDYHVEEL